MKKILSIALAVIMVMCFASCAEGDVKDDILEEDIVRPPVREAEKQARVSFINMSFKEYADYADAIVRLKIGNWIGELESYPGSAFGSTYYNAEVVDVIKGDVPENIILEQAGTSEETLYGYPLFTFGEEMILFIKPAGDSIPNELYDNNNLSDLDTDNIYCAIGWMYCVWNVAYANDGSEYIIPMTCGHLEIDEEFLDYGLANYGASAEDGNGITPGAYQAAQMLMDVDSYDNPGNNPKYVFKLEDFVGYLKDVTK